MSSDPTAQYAGGSPGLCEKAMTSPCPPLGQGPASPRSAEVRLTAHGCLQVPRAEKISKTLRGTAAPIMSCRKLLRNEWKDIYIYIYTIIIIMIVISLIIFIIIIIIILGTRVINLE